MNSFAFILIVMPHDVLRMVEIIVNVNISFTNPDAPETNLQTCLDNLHAICRCIATDVNRMAGCMRACPGPALRTFV